MYLTLVLVYQRKKKGTTVKPEQKKRRSQKEGRQIEQDAQLTAKSSDCFEFLYTYSGP